MDQYSDEKVVPVIHNLEELIAELHKVFASDRVNVEYVKALMSTYKSNPLDWKKYAKFDDFRYTRNLVDSGNGMFNLIALCWGEGQGSSIHDHMNSHCFLKVLDGQLVETNFAWPSKSSTGDGGEAGGREVEGSSVDEEGEPMMQIGCHEYNKDMVTYINDSLGLHRVENMSHTDKAVSLHLYSPPFDTCHTFDERTGHQHTAKITFWSKYGQKEVDQVNAVNGCAAPPVERKKSHCC